MGDDAFVPVYEAANAAGAVIFVHPRDPLQKVRLADSTALNAQCSDGELVSANPNPKILSAGVEFYQDTARGFGDLMRAQYLTSYSKCVVALHLPLTWQDPLDRAAIWRQPPVVARPPAQRPPLHAGPDRGQLRRPALARVLGCAPFSRQH